MNLLIILINIFPCFFSYLKLPFKRNLSNLNNENLMKNLYTNNIYTEINLGTPFQNYNFQIKLNQFPLSILGEEIENTSIKKFSSSSSSNFYLNDSTLEYEEFDFKKGKLLTEKFSLSKTQNNYSEINNFSIFYVTEINKNYYESGIIGLDIEGNPYDSGFAYETNLILQLKKRNLIKKETFNFKYTKEDEGILIIGEYPEFYDSGYKNYTNTAIEFDYVYAKWQIDFSISYNKINLPVTTFSLFEIEKGFIFGNKIFLEEIEKSFFNKFINKKKCFKEIFVYENKNVTYFVCDESVKISEMKELKFTEKRHLNVQFIFNYKDLFYKYKNKYYYLVVFSDDNFWILGKPFFKKYQIIFDKDKKTIGYYKIYNNDNNNNFSFNKLFFVIIILIIIIIFLLYKISFKKETNSKKIRVNELRENYEYLSEDDLENNKKKVLLSN